MDSGPSIHGLTPVALSHVTMTSGQEQAVSLRGILAPPPSWKLKLFSAGSEDLAFLASGERTFYLVLASLSPSLPDTAKTD
jgi:hypothetical protein